MFARLRWLVSGAGIATVAASIFALAQTPSNDPVVDYFNANSKSPSDIFSIGPDGQEAPPPGPDFIMSSPRAPRDCVEGLKRNLRAGIPYSLLQDATRHRFYGYAPIGRPRGFIWNIEGGQVAPIVGSFPVTQNGVPVHSYGQDGPPGGIGNDDQPPNEPRILCLTSETCGAYLACIGFLGKRVPEKTAPAPTSSNPCQQCTITYQASIDRCRANIPVFTNAQYDRCLSDANQTQQACVTRYCPNTGPIPPYQGPRTPVDDQTLRAGVDRCLRSDSRLSYYSSPNITIGPGRASYSNGTITYNPQFLASQSEYGRAFWLGEAFASHVVALERSKYGDRTARDELAQKDLITGFLAHCLVYRNLLRATANLSNDDPRLQFEEFASQSDIRIISSPDVRESNFEKGWAMYGTGLPPSMR